MTAIDVGDLSLAHTYNLAKNTTWFDKANPANASGVIDTVKIWADSKWDSSVTVGTVYGAGTSYQCRDAVNIGIVADLAEATITGLSLEIAEDDYLAAYGYELSYQKGGSVTGNLYYGYAGNALSGGSFTYSEATGRTIAVCGVGEEVSAGSKNKIIIF